MDLVVDALQIYCCGLLGAGLWVGWWFCDVGWLVYFSLIFVGLMLLVRSLSLSLWVVVVVGCVYCL